MNKYIFVILLTIIFVAYPGNIMAADKSGSCGDNATWTLNETGKLVVSGTGKINKRSWNKYKKQINTVIINEGITGICENAFYGTNMSKISLPTSLTSMDEGCFGNTKLRSVTVPEGITRIEDWTFYDCAYLKFINLPDSVTYIGQYAIRQCYSLEQIVLPRSLEHLGDWAFARDYVLEKVVFTGNIVSEDYDLYYDITGPITIYYPADNATWHDRDENINENIIWKAYNDISEIGLESEEDAGDFNIVDGTLLTYHGEGGLVIIPDSVDKIGTRAFEKCLALTSVTIPSNVSVVGKYAFNGCTNLEEINFSEGLETISVCAFNKCSKLKTLDLPDSLCNIGEKAFQKCTGLTGVKFGSKLDYLGDAVFDGCTELKDIDLRHTPRYVGGKAFGGKTAVDRTFINNLNTKKKSSGCVYDYELFLLNKDKLYTVNDSVAAVFFVKTDNPTGSNIYFDFSSGEWDHCYVPAYNTISNF